MDTIGKAVVDATLEAKIIRADGTVEDLGVIARMPHRDEPVEQPDRIEPKVGLITIVKGWFKKHG